jgi:hypothetical protein
MYNALPHTTVVVFEQYLGNYENWFIYYSIKGND